MAGLSDIVGSLNSTANQLGSLAQNTKSQTTTMPSWYDQAQQQIVNQATQGSANIPALQNTVAGQAINNLSGQNNPFTQAQGTLNTIATGAANPWMTDASGNVTPNTNTALGGLFQAQNQELNTLLPQIQAQTGAAGTAAGQFGSLRGQTAQQAAGANAQANLLAQQMQAALTGQQTGVNAATALGNVGAQGTATETTLGQAQQAAPLTSTADLAQILNTIQAPTTVTSSVNTSPLALLGALNSATGGALGGTIGSIGTNVNNWLSNSLSSALGLGGNTPNGSTPTTTPGGYISSSPDISGNYPTNTPTINNPDLSGYNYSTLYNSNAGWSI